MAILKIAKMGNKILKQVAEPVVDIAAENIAALAKDMKETLEDIGGNGLAAPQVHVSKRVVVYRITENQIPAGAQMRPLDWRVLVQSGRRAFDRRAEPYLGAVLVRSWIAWGSPPLHENTIAGHGTGWFGN